MLMDKAIERNDSKEAVEVNGSTSNIVNDLIVNEGSLSVVSEKDYPITILWIFKSPIIILLVNLIALMVGYYFPVLVAMFPVLLIYNPLVRASFHYRLESKYFFVKSGVISKKERNLPYGVIQNVFVKQDLFDRIFGLATLRVENAITPQDVKKKSFWTRNRGFGVNDNDAIGTSGNMVNIPGLKKQSAEALKELILQKIKENPLDDSQSGL